MSFWQKVASGVSKAAEEADKQARIVRLNLQVRETEGSIQAKLRELGQATLDAVRAGKLEEASFSDVVASITQLEATLKEQQEQLNAIQGREATDEEAARATGTPSAG